MTIVISGIRIDELESGVRTHCKLEGKIMPTLTKERIGQFVKTAFQVLAENDGHLAAREVLRLAEPRLNLNDFEKEALPSGAIRWENCLNWYTVDSLKM